MKKTSPLSRSDRIWSKVIESPQLAEIRTLFRAKVKKVLKVDFNSKGSVKEYLLWREAQENNFLYIFDQILYHYSKSLSATFWYLEAFSSLHRCKNFILFKQDLLTKKARGKKPTLRGAACFFYDPPEFAHARGKPVIIVISPKAHATDVKRFLSKNSKEIKRRQKEASISIKRAGFGLRSNYSAIHKERDALIYSLSRCEIDELQMLADSVSKSKDVLISKAMGFAGFTVSSDNVRKIVGLLHKVSL